MRAAIAVLLALLAWPAGAAAQLPRAVITSAPPAETEATEATFAFEASGFALLASFECSLDGAAWQPCTSPVTLTGLTGGTHEFAVRMVGLADPAPARHRWLVLAQTVVTPPPAPPPRPGPPAPPRSRKRRDAAGCAYAANRAGEVPLRRLERATACLIDGIRRERGLARLRRVGSLAVAAQRHARDMVRRRYFAHETLGGAHPVDRARRSGYLRGARGWTLGEVLAWGAGRRSTPAATVRAWMNSRPHRLAILDPGFRDVGVGVTRGVPVRGARRGGGTYAALLGRR